MPFVPGPGDAERAGAGRYRGRADGLIFFFVGDLANLVLVLTDVRGMGSLYFSCARRPVLFYIIEGGLTHMVL